MDEQIISIIAKILEVEPSEIELDCGIGDMPEWSSLKHLQIISELEQAFSIKLQPQDIMELEEIGDLVNLVKEIAKKIIEKK